MEIIIQNILGNGNKSKLTISPSQNQCQIKISRNDEQNQERIVSGITEFLNGKEFKETKRVKLFTHEGKYGIRVTVRGPIFYF
jgi:hypothetical protein